MRSDVTVEIVETKLTTVDVVVRIILSTSTWIQVEGVVVSNVTVKQQAQFAQLQTPGQDPESQALVQGLKSTGGAGPFRHFGHAGSQHIIGVWMLQQPGQPQLLMGVPKFL